MGLTHNPHPQFICPTRVKWPKILKGVRVFSNLTSTFIGWHADGGRSFIYLPTIKCFAFLVLTMAAFNVLSPPTRTCPVTSSPSAVRSDGGCWNHNCRKLPKCGSFPSVVVVSEAEDRRKLNSMPSAKVFGLLNSYGNLE